MSDLKLYETTFYFLIIYSFNSDLISARTHNLFSLYDVILYNQNNECKVRFK